MISFVNVEYKILKLLRWPIYGIGLIVNILHWKDENEEKNVKGKHFRSYSGDTTSHIYQMTMTDTNVKVWYLINIERIFLHRLREMFIMKTRLYYLS